MHIYAFSRLGLRRETNVGQTNSSTTTQDAPVSQECQNNYDSELTQQVCTEFNTGIGENKLSNITTATEDYNYKGGFFTNQQNEVIPAYVKYIKGGNSLIANQVELHVSRAVVIGDNINFRAYVGHELIHITHFSGGLYNRSYSEKVAYRYTYDTFLNANKYSEAFNTLFTASRNSFWGTSPINYLIPKVTSIHF